MTNFKEKILTIVSIAVTSFGTILTTTLILSRENRIDIFLNGKDDIHSPSDNELYVPNVMDYSYNSFFTIFLILFLPVAIFAIYEFLVYSKKR